MKNVIFQSHSCICTIRFVSLIVFYMFVLSFAVCDSIYDARDNAIKTHKFVFLLTLTQCSVSLCRLQHATTMYKKIIKHCVHIELI